MPRFLPSFWQLLDLTEPHAAFLSSMNVLFIRFLGGKALMCQKPDFDVFDAKLPWLSQNIHCEMNRFFIFKRFELSRQKSKFRNTDDLGHFGQENSNCIYGLNICNFACFCAKIRIYREYRNLEFWRENSNEPIWCDLHTLWVLRFVVSGNLSSCIRPFKARFWFVVLVVVVVVQ